MLAPSSTDIALLLPVITVVGAALAVLVVDWFVRDDLRGQVAVSLAGLAAGAWLVLAAWPAAQPRLGFSQGAAGNAAALHLVHFDGVAALASLALLVVAAFTVLVSADYLRRHGGVRAEYFTLVLIATAAMMLMVMAADFILVFLALETFSICLYVLSGYFRDDRRSQEAGMKYFLLGAFAAGFLLYGVALLYASTGATNFVAVRSALAGGQGDATLLARAALALILVGLGFKVAIVPFHQWTPDVYQGAPLPITGFMAAATKLAAFVALARVLFVAFPSLGANWQPLLGVLAVLTMTLGNLVALVQADLKRLLAYSAIAHAGYTLAAIATGSTAGLSAALSYLIAYGLMTLCAFAVLVAMSFDSAVAADGDADHPQISALAGLARRRPGLALALSICLFGLIGFPPTAGFLGKWYIFQATVGAGYTWLAVAVVLNSVLSAFYYLRPILVMVMDGGAAEKAASPAAGTRGIADGHSLAPVPTATALVITLTAGAVALAILIGSPVVNAARAAGEAVSAAGAAQLPR